MSEKTDSSNQTSGSNQQDQAGQAAGQASTATTTQTPDWIFDVSQRGSPTSANGRNKT